MRRTVHLVLQNLADVTACTSHRLRLYAQSFVLGVAERPQEDIACYRYKKKHRKQLYFYYIGST